MPNIDCIIADKLTAFAPTSIGIPLSAEPGKRPKRVEILKQMFDIGNLFDLCDNLDDIRKTYITIAEHEISNMHLEIQNKDVLEDTLRFAFVIGHGGKLEKEHYQVLSKGIKDFNKFVSDMSFDENKAVLCAAKISYIVNLIKSDSSSNIEHYNDSIDMTNWEIKNKEFKTFNNYKFSNPEAFFYWYKAINKNN